MAIAGEVRLKVTPEQLQTKAQVTTDNIAQLKTVFENIGSIVARTQNYWIGEAGDLHRRLYTDEREQIEELFARLSEHPADLEQIAQTYLNVEKVVENISLELPGDVIS
ncbi:MAG: WXG100 family type VII secretion target [Lachnospiraceae bacterium]|nr:WXG100 family type VII secretion target [Lachnospiraceae bacterium]MDE7028752.1 WXG100 family type VII secretion target [Lachnospiraceae bacterium]